MIKNKFLWLLLPLLTLFIFLFLRAINLNSVPVFVDEAIYVRWSQVMKSEASLRFLPMSDGKQPLYMWATIPFLKLFADPLIAARSLSIFAGLGSLIGVSVLTFLFYNNLSLAVLSGLLYATLPFSVFFDRMALVDSLLAMFGVWSLVFFKKFLDKRSLDWAMLTGFMVGGGLLTKSPAVIYYLWLALLFIFVINFKVENKKSFLNLVLGFAYILIISQGLNAILKLGPNSQMVGSRNLDYVYTLKEIISHPLTPIVGNLKTTLSWLWILLTPTTLLGVLLAWKEKKYRPLFWLLLLCSLFPLLTLSLIAKVFTSRYLLFAVYPLIPLAALGLSKLRFYFLMPLMLIPLFISTWFVFSPSNSPLPYDMANGYYQEWTAGWGQKEIANYLIDLHNQGKSVVVFTEGFFGTLPDGLQIYTQKYPNITVVGSIPIATEIPQGLLNTSLNNERFFIINKSRNKLPPQQLAKLELIKDFPKYPRPDGTQEFLQFYRLK